MNYNCLSEELAVGSIHGLELKVSGNILAMYIVILYGGDLLEHPVDL